MPNYQTHPAILDFCSFKKCLRKIWISGLDLLQKDFCCVQQ